MVKSKTNDEANRVPSSPSHHKASDEDNAEMNRLKRDRNHIQKVYDREGMREFDSSSKK
jgi:hypothetical protein